MAKLKQPLLSLGATGTVADTITYQRRHRQHYARKKPIPTDIKSLAQLTWRHMYQKAVALWHALSSEEKQEWESLARPKHMTGFAWFMSQCLRPNPGIYLPLQGGIMQGEIDMDDHQICGLVDPVNGNNAARKAYVDTLIAADIATHTADPDAHHTDFSSLEFIIDGGGSAITTGEKGHLEVPFTCNIIQASLLADQDGAIKIDIWSDSYALFPPTDADSICGGNEPEIIATGDKDQDATLAGWTTELPLGNILAFNVDTCTTITRVTISLIVRKS